jgi:arylformamidase
VLDAAIYLKNIRAILVRIDTLKIDDTQEGYFPALTLLLEANKTIIEQMTNLNQLPQAEFILFAAPPKIIKIGSFPV